MTFACRSLRGTWCCHHIKWTRLRQVLDLGAHTFVNFGSRLVCCVIFDGPQGMDENRGPGGVDTVDPWSTPSFCPVASCSLAFTEAGDAQLLSRVFEGFCASREVHGGQKRENGASRGCPFCACSKTTLAQNWRKITTTVCGLGSVSCWVSFPTRETLGQLGRLLQELQKHVMPAEISRE